jgi:hypothetical protein
VDWNIEVDEALNAEVAIEIKAFDESVYPSFHAFLHADLLLVDGLDLHEFVLVLKIKEKGVVDKVKICGFGDVDFKLFDRLEELG